MDLGLFSSAVNYATSRAFNSANQNKCVKHPISSANQIRQNQTIENRNSVNQITNSVMQNGIMMLNDNSNKCSNDGVCTHKCNNSNFCSHKCKSQQQQLNKSLASSSNSTSNQLDNSLNKMNVGNQRPITANQNVKINYPPNTEQQQAQNHNELINGNRIPIINRNAQNILVQTNNRLPNLNNGFNHTTQATAINHIPHNTLANRLNNPMIPHPFSNQSLPANLAISTAGNPIPMASTPIEHHHNPFSANKFSSNAAVWNNDVSNHLNASFNLNGAANPMMNQSLNQSYNFGIWRNCTNLDLSTNWSKLKENRVKRCANSTNENISEEDTCSMRSDSESCAAENFNCFNPANSLNLHENFRTLTVDNCQNISNYPIYSTAVAYPVIQQQ